MEFKRLEGETRVAMVKRFFDCTNSELLELKKTDPEGFEQLCKGLEDGTFTY